MDRNRTRITRPLGSLLLAASLLTAGTIANIATVTVALAQDQPSGPPPAGRHNQMGAVLMSLNLSDAQKAQIRSIIADARKQNQSVADRDQKRANMRAAYDKVKTVLTPAQRSQFDAKIAALRQNQPQHAQ